MNGWQMIDFLQSSQMETLQPGAGFAVSRCDQATKYALKDFRMETSPPHWTTWKSVHPRGGKSRHSVQQIDDPPTGGLQAA
jgi:hypothetical protein